MLTLVSSNASKYALFAADLERLRILLLPPREPLPELQELNFAASLVAKARAAAMMFGRPVLVDDAGLVLDAYRPFPGPLTSSVVSSLGLSGLRRLLSGVQDGATMECHIGCWLEGNLRSWSGKVRGHIDFSRPVRDERMMLSDLFVPDGEIGGGSFLHRARALEALERSVFDLHLAVNRTNPPDEPACNHPPAYQCPFCNELDGDDASIFASMMGDRLRSRVIYEDEHFVVMPALGEFIEGGLLLLTREHIHSFACLPAERLEALERLLAAVCGISRKHWGVQPLVFEHGSTVAQSKGGCCVDHAHLNIFPATVLIHPHLTKRMNMAIGPLAELANFRRAEFGYLFVQENDGSRRVYDGQHVVTQLVRRIITAEIGLPERWHWRDYPGLEELLATYHALKGQLDP